MREILFRGKRTNNGEWIEGYLYSISEEYNPFIMLRNRCAESYQVDSETVGQYTGFIDKDGKKIFEGDVVRERGGESCQGYYEIDNVLIVEIPDTLVNFEMSCDCEYKIIGNIHDNPELLGDKDGK